MRVLIVGAGAVGQVFGHHLQLGGAEVSFLVKPKYVEECERGFVMYKLPKLDPVRFDGAKIVTAPAGTYDHVYITVSSTALRGGTWFGELAKATGDATIIALQPGLDDHAFIAEHAGSERVVDGTIMFLSYHAPLPGETRFAAPGMAYWFFPGKAPFSGTAARVDAVIAALRAGKLPARRMKNVNQWQVFPAALMSTFVAALEASNWSFKTMRGGGRAALGAKAAREAMKVVSHERGVSAPFGPRMAARGFVFRTLSRVMPRLAPVDLETYMKVHFTKVSDQMHEGLAKYAERGRAAHIAVPALEQLAKLLPSG